MARPRTPFALVGLLALLLLLPASASARPAGWGTDLGEDPVATIADLKVSRAAIAPGRAGDARVALGFRSTTQQQLRITVLDAAGREVRTIVDEQVGEGHRKVTWDGRRADGTMLDDGRYELVVEAGTARETMSISDEVRIDSRPPVVAAAARKVRLASWSASGFLLPIAASEAALVELSTTGAAGRARATSAPKAGRGSLLVPIARRAALRRALADGRAYVTVRITAIDAAGNRSVRAAHVQLLPPAPAPAEPGDATPAPDTGSSRMSWPVSGPITSRFGPRWGRMHTGIDVAAPRGRTIASAAPGRVSYAGWMGGYGNTVIVDHGALSTLYAHQSRILVGTGAQVARGQAVGLVGSTGNSTGPHLHFEVRSGGSPRDPLHYLP